jgi:hypothetical protein
VLSFALSLLKAPAAGCVKDVVCVKDRMTVAVIGGSQTAAQLIADFVSRPFVDVVGVADLDEDSPGAKAARSFGIFFTSDIHDLSQLGEDVDLVIDVCGKPHVNLALEETFGTDGETVVVHDLVARLVLSLAADSSELAPPCSAPTEAAC